MPTVNAFDPYEVAHDPSLEPVKVTPRDESGKFLPKPKSLTAQEEEKVRRAAYDRVMQHAEAAKNGVVLTEQPADAKAKADAPKGEVTDESESVDEAALAAAKANAKRLKIPQKFLDAMSPQELVESGKDWANEVKEKLSVSRELGELRKELASLKQPKESAPETGQPGDDLDTLLAKPLAELDVDEGTGKGLGGLFKAYDSRIASRLEKVEKALAEEAVERTARLVDEAKNKLLARCPQLGDEDDWQRVAKRAVSLKETGDFDNYPDLIEAAYLSLKLPLADPPSQLSTKPSTGKRNGVAQTSSASPRPASTPKDPEAQKREIFDRIVAQARTSSGTT